MGAELGLPQRSAEQPGERGWLLGLQLLTSHRVCMELISLADAESYAALPLRGKKPCSATLPVLPPILMPVLPLL